MHFSIPDTQDVEDNNGSTFNVFNIHVNGAYHCSVRYSQLHKFHEQLKKEVSASNLPQFPPKKLLSLNLQQLETRRILLERYIQQVSQISQVGSSTTFNSFLLNAQKESQHQAEEDVSLDIYLMNGHKITINILSTDQTDTALEAAASEIQLDDEFVYYFGLFLMKKDDSNETSIVRQLQEFESPYISLKAASQTSVHKIVIRKCYWDSTYDNDLIEDRVAMNLLYVQAVSDIERQWTLANKDQLRQLKALQKRNSKKEYLQFCQTLKFYGHIFFRPCLTDYPHPKSRVLICAGNRDLVFQIGDGSQTREFPFKVTRMRCWRITTTIPDSDGDVMKASASASLELAFEYLMAKDVLKWITVSSSQAILMSMCLQSMVEELIMKKQGQRFKRPHDRLRGKRKDVGIVKNNTSNTPSKSTSAQSQEKFSPFGVLNVTGTGSNPLMENDAFEGIGDDDL